MNPANLGLLDFVTSGSQPWNRALIDSPGKNLRRAHSPPDVEFLRHCAWDIGEQKPADSYVPPASHVGLAMVNPYQGYAHWRIRHEWIEQTARHKGDAWHHCRMVLRVYDVSYIVFDGLNAHRMQDVPLPSTCGQLFFPLPRPGTWQLAEAGFVLRSGEFIAAARSQTVRFAPDAPAGRGDQAALLVEQPGRGEPVGNVWDQERILQERRQPKLRQPLRIAAFAFEALPAGQDGALARFVSELAAGQCQQGHEVHVFVPETPRFPCYRLVDGVHYQPVAMHANGTPADGAKAFARGARQRLEHLPPFDLFHLHEWMTGLAPWDRTRPTVLSLSSLETTRRNGCPVGPLSRAIEQTERRLAQSVDLVLTPDWLRERALAELGLDAGQVQAFAMEGRLPNEWDCPLDYGQVKKEIGLGPLDRVVLYVGPLEHAAGVDLLLEAMPVLLQRVPEMRLVFVGAGNLYGHLEHRARQLGVSHALRLLGHRERPQVARLLRSAEGLVLPSRYRIPFDDAVVDLARRAGRPVITTHGGPAHLVRHEETGLITYDNPGSMVWALDRLLGDPAHAGRMGQRGRRHDGSVQCWTEVAQYYLELCAARFPELNEPRG